jgi:hypothetical protein
MTTPTAEPNGQRRATLSRGDKAALIAGVLLALYALGWFTLRSAQNLKRDRAVAPAPVALQFPALRSGSLVGLRD